MSEFHLHFERLAHEALLTVRRRGVVVGHVRVPSDRLRAQEPWEAKGVDLAFSWRPEHREARIGLETSRGVIPLRVGIARIRELVCPRSVA